MPLVAFLSGNLLRHPFFTPFHHPPPRFEIKTSRGLYQQEHPLTNRAAQVFLTLVALADQKGEIRLSRHAFLKACGLKLYNQDLENVLKRLVQTECSFKGSFYREGRFGDARNLRLVSTLTLPERDQPLVARLEPWVLADPYPIDVSLFAALSPLARRLYLYFSFTLAQGSFTLGLKHLAAQIPVLTKRQGELFEARLPGALEELRQAGVLEHELWGPELFVRPAEGLLKLRRLHPPPRPPRPGAKKVSLNLLFLGRGHCGKSQRLGRLSTRLKEAPRGLKPLYLPCLFSLTDWLAQNFEKKDYRGLSAVERRKLLLEAASQQFVLVDDLERATAQKQALVKECLARAPRFAATARTYRDIPEPIRLTLEKRGFREIQLKSATTRDISFALLALIVLVAVVMGHHEWLLGLLAARLFLRQPP